MTPPPAPDPEPVDDYDRDARTRQGNPSAMRCRLCNGSRATRRLPDPDRPGVFFHLHYCPTCDHIPLRSKG